MLNLSYWRHQLGIEARYAILRGTARSLVVIQKGVALLPERVAAPFDWLTNQGRCWLYARHLGLLDAQDRFDAAFPES